MSKNRARSRDQNDSARPGATAPTNLRIIGGHFRGRRLKYHGDPRTRPMKDRVREAVFNLIGPEIKDKQAIDLFAGTGALGLEALSRGAARALLIERHFPTAAVIRENIRTLDVADRADILAADALHWGRRRDRLGPQPWVVFCSPPYDLYVDRPAEMVTLIRDLVSYAPPTSVIVVEADQRFDFATLGDLEPWDRREYPPAYVGIYRKRFEAVRENEATAEPI